MTDRILAFERAGRAFALNAGDVSEIAADRPLVTVPRAPSAVAGLAIERGRLITVIELDRLLRIRAPAEGPSHLVVLAAPYGNLALRVNSKLQLEDAGAREVRPEVIEVARLIETIEAVIASTSHRATQGA